MRCLKVKMRRHPPWENSGFTKDKGRETKNEKQNETKPRRKRGNRGGREVSQKEYGTNQD